jgi:hypothetical protein
MTSAARGGVIMLSTTLVFALEAHRLRADPPPPRCELVSAGKIWDAAPHNAFTDLIRWQDRFYCAFREGQGHAGDRGRLRIIVSNDGQQWESAGLLVHDQFDLRDAALAVMPDGRLMVLGGAQQLTDGARRTGTFVSFTRDGHQFTTPHVVFPPGRWLWRVTTHDDAAYGVSYGTPENPQASALHKTTDGLSYQTVLAELLNDGEHPTEARLRFASDGTCYCLHRRDGTTKYTAQLGRAKPPYTVWRWQDLERRLGGPNFLQLPSGHWIAAGRLSDGGPRTELLSLGIEQGTMTPILRLPSGGDTSYPGMLWYDDLLWVSYYASHEGRTSIYLAKVRFP